MAGRTSLLVWCFLTLLAAPAELCEDPEVGGLSFLQAAAASRARAPLKTCLRFMHIPKTGGTSIDSANIHLPEGHRAFDSLMLRTFKRASAVDGRPLGAMFDEAHSSSLSYDIFMALHPGASRYVPPGAQDMCEDLHTPPARSSAVQRHYLDPACTSFCAVREPLSRYLSAFKMFFRDCDPQSVEARTLELLSKLAARPYLHNCMFVPQVEFVYGAASKSAATHQYCQRILHQEKLDKEFAALMGEVGRTVQLPETDVLASWTDHCNMSVHDLSQKTRTALMQYFKEDYVAFGYVTERLASQT